MADKSIRRTIRSLKRNIDEHKSKPPSKHHAHEIRVFEEQLKLAEAEATRRGLLGAGIIFLEEGDGEMNNENLCKNIPEIPSEKISEDISEEEAERRTSSWFDWIDPFLSPSYAY